LKDRIQTWYDVAYSEQVIADLGWFKKYEQNEILDEIDQQLCHEPTVETRKRKHLRPNTTAEWELRIGNAFFFQGRKDDL
jgi:hypothetical protein